MWRLLRIPVLWLIAFAIPVQGFALAAQRYADLQPDDSVSLLLGSEMHCPDEQGLLQQQEALLHPPPPSPQGLKKEPGSAHPKQYGKNAKGNLTKPLARALGSDGFDERGESKSGKCGSCHTAPPSGPIFLAVPTVSFHLLDSSLPGILSFLTSAPERPPRPPQS